MHDRKESIIVINKIAKRNYHLGDKFQAGVALNGWEVKSLRNGKVDIKDSYVNVIKNEAWLIGAKIDPPASLKNESIDSTKSRKLLLHKKEIRNIKRMKDEKGLTCILTKIYWKDSLIKCEIVMGKGKKLYDKRQVKKTRDWKREKARLLSKNNK